nr:regulatory protein GemA [Mannheimia haemolytica]
MFRLIFDTHILNGKLSLFRVNCQIKSDLLQLMTVLQTMKAKGFVVKSKKYGKRPTASKTAPHRQGLINKIGALLYQSQKPWDYAHAIAKRSFGIERVQWLTDEQLHKLVQMLASYNYRHGMSV